MTTKVIVADDDPGWRRIYADMIKPAFPDAQVDQVETGTDLVAGVLHGDYSLVISGNDMEAKNAGLEALKKIRASGNRIPFYVVSGGSIGIARDAMRYGADDFYDKGRFDRDQVLKDIAKHLR